MVVLLDPTEDPDDILRANRSREKRYIFDVAFDETSDQVNFGLAISLLKCVTGCWATSNNLLQ